MTRVNSKYISYLLRHDKRVGQLVDEQGFISIDDLNRLIDEDRHCSVTDTELIAFTEDPTTKKRFEYQYRTREVEGQSSGRLFYIRAMNGHSFALKTNIFEPWSAGYSPQYVYHATNHRSVESILREGLKPMSRQYVHLYESRDQVYFDGKRNTLLEIGPVNGNEFELYRSKNGYLMSPRVIQPRFIKSLGRVTQRSSTLNRD